MKITGYTQQVTNVSGSGSAPTLNASVQAKAAASDVVDMSPVAKGLGDWAKTIDDIHDQEDRQNILNAKLKMAQAQDDLLYNDKTGLMNTKLGQVEDIAQKYKDGMDKIRADVLGTTKLYGRANKMGLERLADETSFNGLSKVQRHIYQQTEAKADLDYNNLQSREYAYASNNYFDGKALEKGESQVLQNVSLRYGKKGEEAIENATRAALAEYGNSAMLMAVAQNDIAAQSNILDKYGEYMTPQQRANYKKLSFKQQESNWEYSILDKLKGKSTKEAMDYIDGLTSKSFVDMGGGETISQGMEKLAPTMEYYDPNDRRNTYCAKAITSTPALKGSKYEGVVWVPTLMEIAKNNKEWHDVNEPGFIPQANDIAIVNGDSHAVVVAEDGGTWQNGSSGRNGKGGIYHSTSSPAEMFPNAVTGYIRVKQTGQARTITQPITREEKERVRRLALNQIEQEHNIKQKGIRDIQENVRQEIFNKKDNLTFEAAQKQYVTDRKWNTPEERDAAAAAVALEFGVTKSTAKGMTGLRKNQGKGDKMVDYELQKLIESNAFSNAEGLPDRQVLMEYLGSTECSDLTQTQKYKAITLFDNFKDKTGPYKIKWSDFDDQMLEGNSFTGAAKEYALANCRAAALDFIMNYKPHDNLGRQFPTMEEIVREGKKGMLTNWKFSYTDEEDSWLGGTKTVTKTASIPFGAMAAAGYTYWKDEGDNSTLATVVEGGITRNVPKRELAKKFKQ